MRPNRFPVVFETLKNRGDIVQFIVAEERVLADAELFPLTFHYVDGIVEDTLDQKIAQFGHEDVGTGKIAQRDRQRAHMVMVTMGDGDSVRLEFLDDTVERATV